MFDTSLHGSILLENIQPRTQALLPTPGAAAKTLAKAGHVTSQILGGKLNYTKGGVVEERICNIRIFWEVY